MQRELCPAQDKSDLGSVAMRYDNLPAGFDHASDMLHRFICGEILIGNRLVGFIADQ